MLGSVSPPGDGTTGVTGPADVLGTVGRWVGKLGSPPGPHPGQVAAPSMVVLHPAAAAPATTSHTTARPAFTRWEMRTFARVRTW